MKVIERTQPFLYEAFTNKIDPDVPAGKIRIRLVTFETIELEDGVDDMTHFNVLDWNRPEVRALKKGGKDL